MDTGERTTERARPFTIATDPQVDRFASIAIGADTTLRLLYLRCAEARAQQLPGQDYAEIQVNRQDGAISFCVCDGVGGSYRGDLAARYLAQRLVSWLSAPESAPENSDTLQADLMTRLEQWAATCQRDVEKSAIPAESSPLVREVLEEVRAAYGSETVFFAGRISYGAGSVMEAPVALATFCWMGNVRAQLIADDGDEVDLRQSGDDAVRWSTGRGLCGEPTVRVLRLHRLRRLVVHTDGADHLSQRIVDLSDDELQERARQLQAHPTNDDMTILDVQWSRR